MKYHNIEIPHGSRDHVIIPNTVKIAFNLDITSTDKARSVVNNVDKALVKKKVLILGSKEVDTINNSDIRFFTRAKKNVKRSYFKVYSRPLG